MLLVGGLLEFLEVHFKLPYPRFKVQKVPRQLLGDVQAGHPSLHSLVGTLWPCALHFSCMLFGYTVVVVHDAPLCPISRRFSSYPSQNPLATHCGALLTRLCLKPQAIPKHQTRTYIPSPADDAPSPRPRYAVRRAYHTAYRGDANFGELRIGEVRRIPLMSTSSMELQLIGFLTATPVRIDPYVSLVRRT